MRIQRFTRKRIRHVGRDVRLREVPLSYKNTKKKHSNMYSVRMHNIRFSRTCRAEEQRASKILA